MTASTQGHSTTGAQKRTRNLFEEFRPVMTQLIQVEQFSAFDVVAGREEYHKVVQKLKNAGAIRHAGRTDHKVRDDRRKWAWKPKARAQLREYIVSRPAFEQCGHRAHVHHESDGSLGCQYCDVARDYDREMVREAMSK